MKKVPLYKKKGDAFVKVGEEEADELLEDLKEDDVEDVEAVYLWEEEEESEGEEKKIHIYKPE